MKVKATADLKAAVEVKETAGVQAAVQAKAAVLSATLVEQMVSTTVPEAVRIEPSYSPLRQISTPTSPFSIKDEVKGGGEDGERMGRLS